MQIHTETELSFHLWLFRNPAPFSYSYPTLMLCNWRRRCRQTSLLTQHEHLFANQVWHFAMNLRLDWCSDSLHGVLWTIRRPGCAMCLCVAHSTSSPADSNTRPIVLSSARICLLAREQIIYTNLSARHEASQLWDGKSRRAAYSDTLQNGLTMCGITIYCGKQDWDVQNRWSRCKVGRV